MNMAFCAHTYTYSNIVIILSADDMELCTQIVHCFVSSWFGTIHFYPCRSGLLHFVRLPRGQSSNPKGYVQYVMMPEADIYAMAKWSNPMVFWNNNGMQLLGHAPDTCFWHRNSLITWIYKVHTTKPCATFIVHTVHALPSSLTVILSHSNRTFLGIWVIHSIAH